MTAGIKKGKKKERKISTLDRWQKGTLIIARNKNRQRYKILISPIIRKHQSINLIWGK